jgi:hypothetical protein
MRGGPSGLAFALQRAHTSPQPQRHAAQHRQQQRQLRHPLVAALRCAEQRACVLGCGLVGRPSGLKLLHVALDQRHAKGRRGRQCRCLRRPDTGQVELKLITQFSGD